MSTAATSTERVLVCGLGHVAYRVARLLRRLGVGVSVVSQSVRAEWARALGHERVAIVSGDPTDEANLEKAEISSATALVGAADADLENLEVALDARRLNADLRLVLRVF